MYSENLGSADKGLLACMAAFDAVRDGDKDAYARAFCKEQREVKDAVLQLAMVDCILAARTRAYGGKV